MEFCEDILERGHDLSQAQSNFMLLLLLLLQCCLVETVFSGKYVHMKSEIFLDVNHEQIGIIKKL